MNNVGNHIFLWCKIFGLKIRRCKNLDKYHVWARALTFNQENSDNMPPRNYWLGCLVFQISIYFKSLRSSASPLEHKTCDILAAERLRLMRFDHQLIIEAFQKPYAYSNGNFGRVFYIIQQHCLWVNIVATCYPSWIRQMTD